MPQRRDTPAARAALARRRQRVAQTLRKPTSSEASASASTPASTLAEAPAPTLTPNPRIVSDADANANPQPRTLAYAGLNGGSSTQPQPQPLLQPQLQPQSQRTPGPGPRPASVSASRSATTAAAVATTASGAATKRIGTDNTKPQIQAASTTTKPRTSAATRIATSATATTSSNAIRENESYQPIRRHSNTLVSTTTIPWDEVSSATERNRNQSMRASMQRQRQMQLQTQTQTQTQTQLQTKPTMDQLYPADEISVAAVAPSSSSFHAGGRTKGIPVEESMGIPSSKSRSRSRSRSQSQSQSQSHSPRSSEGSNRSSRKNHPPQQEPLGQQPQEQSGKIQYDICMSAPTMEGEDNIETVLKDGIAASGSFASEYNHPPKQSQEQLELQQQQEQQPAPQQQQPQEQQMNQQPDERQAQTMVGDRQPLSLPLSLALPPQERLRQSPEKFERVSNFGYVERTSPQPRVPDRRNLVRYSTSNGQSMRRGSQGSVLCESGNSVSTGTATATATATVTATATATMGDYTHGSSAATAGNLQPLSSFEVSHVQMAVVPVHFDHDDNSDHDHHDHFYYRDSLEQSHSTDTEDLEPHLPAATASNNRSQATPVVPMPMPMASVLGPPRNERVDSDRRSKNATNSDRIQDDGTIMNHPPNNHHLAPRNNADAAPSARNFLHANPPTVVGHTKTRTPTAATTATSATSAAKAKAIAATTTTTRSKSTTRAFPESFQRPLPQTQGAKAAEATNLRTNPNPTPDSARVYAGSNSNDNAKNTILGAKSRSGILPASNSAPVAAASNGAGGGAATAAAAAAAIPPPRVVSRASRIPSPKPINPGGSRVIPKRNSDSPRRTTKSPEKRLSPRRFRTTTLLARNNSNKNQNQNQNHTKNKSGAPSAAAINTPPAADTAAGNAVAEPPRPPPEPMAATTTTSSSSSSSSLEISPPLPTSTPHETSRPLPSRETVRGLNDHAINKNNHNNNKNNNYYNNTHQAGKLPVPMHPDDLRLAPKYHTISDRQLQQQQELPQQLQQKQLPHQHKSHQHHDLPREPVLQSRSVNNLGEKATAKGMQQAPPSTPIQQIRRDRVDPAATVLDDAIDRRMNQSTSTNTNTNSQLPNGWLPTRNDRTKPVAYSASMSTPTVKWKAQQQQPADAFANETTHRIQTEETRNHHREAPRNHRQPRDLDAACLQSGDSVMLRSCSLSATIQTNDRDGVLAEFHGSCLGKEAESLTIVKVGDNGFPVVCHGDVVVLLLIAATPNRSLGVRRIPGDVSGVDEIGFFGDGTEPSDRWRIGSARAGRKVLVGRAAVEMGTAVALAANHDAEPIKSGNSILLTNCSNGGVLSIRDGVAVLRTDSYDPSTARSSENPSLLGRLDSNDQLEPSLPETFQLLKLVIPPCPTWAVPKGMGERFFLNGSYLFEPFRNPNETIVVDKDLSSENKENILVDEIIGSFLGLEGVYIRYTGSEGVVSHEKPPLFRLLDTADTSFDLSLRNLVDQILPLSTSYLRVRNFIGAHYPGYEYGRIMQAFCEGLDSFLQQFVAFVAQLEQKVRKPPSSGVFSMKNIHFEITPVLHSMSILEHTTKVAYSKKGGDLINALRSLEKRVYMGDTVAKDLLGTLLDRASAPYAEMLSIWLQSGRLVDPYDEFMIRKTSENKNGVRLDGDTWSALFTINEDHVIRDIVRNEKYKNKILVTGKYWNAVQACTGQTMTSSVTRCGPLELKNLQFQSDSSHISSFIDTMYDAASEKLLNLLRDEFNLRESLQMMKRYFLLDQGDFLMNFLEAAGEELAKPFEEVSIGRVQHFLGISVQLTESQKNDEFDLRSCKKSRRLLATSLRCRLAEQSLVSYLDSLYGGIEGQGPNTPSRRMYGSQKQGTAGFDFFEIDFPRIPFPISLIISPTSMENYKMLFRHLFFAKHVERRLVGVWRDHQVFKKLDAVRGLLGPTFMLRQRMLHFVQNLMNYMTFEVVESNWLGMLSSIEVSEDPIPGQKQQTVDDLVKIHDGFLQQTIDACLLRNPNLIKILIKLLNTCLLFTDQMKRFMDTTKIHDDSFNIAVEKRDAVQRNLNERLTSQLIARDRNKMGRSMMSVKEERDILLQRQTRRVGREICSESYKKMIRRFEEVFNADLSAFMTELNSHTFSGIVANLGIRLDWNQYVTSTMALQNSRK